MDKAYRPLNLDEALEMAETEAALPLAGGTDLMVQHRRWSGLPPDMKRPVMFIGHLKELQEVHSESDGLVIGSGTTLAAILRNERIPSLLKEAVRSIGGPAIRSRATLGGNICNASPAADTLPPLYVLGAELVLRRKNETRTVPVASFVQGPGKTMLKKGELLTEIRLPAAEPAITFYRKVGTRSSNALSKLSIAAAADSEEDVVTDVGIAIGAVAPTVVCSPDAENLMRGRTAAEIRGELYRILEAYNSKLEPIDDQRSSSLYRLKASFRLILSFIGKVLLPALESNTEKLR